MTKDKLLEIYYKRHKAVQYLKNINIGNLKRFYELSGRLLEIERTIYELKKIK